MVPVFKNIEERSMIKNYSPVSLLSVVIKIGLLFTSENEAFLSDFHYGFISSQSNADLLSDVSDRIISISYRLRTT